MSVKLYFPPDWILICTLAYLCLSKYSIQIGEGNNEENENNIHELATFSNEAFHQEEEN